ncbi:MAG: tetratricopeptide repeat protein [Sarcina sp.]
MEFKNAIKKEKMLIIKYLIGNKQYDIAMNTLNELRKKNEDDVQVLVEIAKLHMTIGELEKSMSICIYILDVLSKVEERNTKLQKGGVYVLIATIYSKQGNMESYNEYMNKALGCGLPSEHIFSHKAATFEGKKDFDSAIEFYEKVLIKDKRSIVSFMRLYTIYLNRNDIEKCFDIADRIINNFGDYKGYHLKFELNLKLNERGKALEILNLAKEEIGHSDELNTDYIKLLILSDRYDEALEVIDGIDPSSKSYTTFMIQKANVYIGKGDRESALKVVEEIYDPKNIITVSQMGIVKLFIRDYEGAIAEFELIEKVNAPQSFKDLSLILKGRAIRECRNKAKQEEYFELLNQIFKTRCMENPSDIQAKLYRVLAFVEYGKFLDAKRILREIEASGLIEKAVIENFKNIIAEMEIGNIDDKNFFSGIIF